MISKSDNSIKELEKLKEKLDTGQMSVIIGAGFSRNTSDLFPLWTDLLEDMVVDLYGNKIDTEYREKVLLRESIGTLDNFRTKKVEEYIKDVGYLNLVELYIEKYGYREVVTSYIEERTPQVQIEGDRKYLYLTKTDERVELTDIDLLLHKKIVNLPWNNIYTTNYDELLDIHVQDSLISSLDVQIQHLEEEREPIKKYSKDNADRLQQIQYDINKLKDLRKNSFNLVTKASELSVSKNKNIVKLHGSLRKDKEVYGFDGDITTQYIFSKSDYESYPEKHEAFTQLMRISLLQESFCLIGFSGEDPNFLEWVKWVRDVLKSNKNKDSKIYFISTGKDNFSSSKKLFFKNHNICPIFLGENEVQNYLLNDYNNTLDFKERKKSIDTFLHFLDANLVDTIQLNKERLERLKYINIWNNLVLKQLSNEDEGNVQSILEYLKPLDSLKSYTSFINDDQVVENKKVRFIRYVSSLVTNDKISMESKKKLFTYSLMALKDLNLSISTFFDKSKKKFLDQFVDNKLYIDNRSKEWLLLGEGGKLLLNDKDYGIYCNILNDLFHFNYEGAKVLVDEWSPDNFLYNIKKACLLSYFDYDKSFDYLKKHEPVLIKNCLDDILLYSQVYRLFVFVKGFHNNEYTKRLKLIKELESFGYVSLYDFFISQLKSLDTELPRIEYYGKCRYTYTNSNIVSNKISYKGRSQAILNGLITVGVPLVTNGVTFLSKEEWYKVFVNVFQQYPYPCLFYSLQYADEKFIRRIAQDYMYYDKDGRFLDSITPKLLNIYLSELSNPTLRKSILFFCSEVLVAVKSDIWNPFVNIILQEANLFAIVDKDNTNGFELFINGVVTYTDDEGILNKIFEDCIKQIEVNTTNDYPSGYVYDILILLRNRKYIYKIGDSYLKEKIDLIITREIVVKYYGIFIYCLYPVLSKEQEKKILQELENSVFQEWDDIRFVYYLFEEKNLISIDIFKSLVFNSKMLFTSWKIENDNWIRTDFIRLSHFYKIKWTNKERKEMYTQICIEWKNIKQIINSCDFEMTVSLSSFKELIKEMYLFLLTYEKCDKDIFNEISELHFNYRGYRDEGDVFINYDNGAGTVNGLHDLSNRLYLEEFESENRMLISIILNNILMFKKVRLEESINFLRGVIEDKKKSLMLKDNKMLLEAILKKYSEKLPPDSDNIYILLHMIKIAKGYKKLFGVNQIVEYWLNFEKTTRFNKNYIS